MSRVNIYITDNTRLCNVLIRLVERVYIDGYRISFLCKKQDIDLVDSLLWTGTNMFIPHGTLDEHQTGVYITHNINDIIFAGCLMTYNVVPELLVVNKIIKHFNIVVHVFNAGEEGFSLNELINYYKYYDQKPVVWEFKNDQWCKQ